MFQDKQRLRPPLLVSWYFYILLWDLEDIAHQTYICTCTLTLTNCLGYNNVYQVMPTAIYLNLASSDSSALFPCIAPSNIPIQYSKKSSDLLLIYDVQLYLQDLWLYWNILNKAEMVSNAYHKSRCCSWSVTLLDLILKLKEYNVVEVTQRI